MQPTDAQTLTIDRGHWSESLAQGWATRDYPNAVDRDEARCRARRALDTLEKMVLAGLLALLAIRLVPHLADKPMNVVYLVAETVIVVMVAFRRGTTQVSLKPADWVIGFAGTFLPLLVSASDSPGFADGRLLMLFGSAVSIGAQLSLRRSFGVVAANRGVMTAGLYTAVRHPMYLGYFFTHAGFLLMNPSVSNAAICAVWTGCQLYRIHVEERVLSADPAYVAFQDRVRYRLIPLIY